MKIFNERGGFIGFKGARINIVENSDNHGNLNTLPDFYNTIKQNAKDIFKKSDKESTLNLYINAGDFFMNPSKGGILSFPEKTNGDVQKEFLELLVAKIKKAANTICYEKNKEAKEKGLESNLQATFDALYTPGNHCFDGGDKMFYSLLRSIKGLTTVMTNVNLENSPLFVKEQERKNSNFVTKKLYEVPDDKEPANKDKNHHVMVLGATIPAMDSYNPGLVTETDFCDWNDKKDSKMGKEDIQKTIGAIKVEVDAFKKAHPKGIVILSSHMGTKLSGIIRDEVPGITEILDAHKHDIVTSTKTKHEANISSFIEKSIAAISKAYEAERSKGNKTLSAETIANLSKIIKDGTEDIAHSGTTISSLGQDNDIVKAISLIIDDNGDIEERESRTYSSDQYRLEKYSRKENALHRLLTKKYEKDYKPLIKVKGDYPGFTSFDYKPEIRNSNSYLANFLTTSVKQSIEQIPGQENISAVGIQSSIIRGGIADGSNNFDILKVFDGVSEDLSDVKVGTINGRELVLMIKENIKENLADPDRNTIIHWSDIQVDRDGFAAALKKDPDLSISQAAKYITVRDEKGGFKKRVYANDLYKIAIADKYLKKTDIMAPKIIGGRFESIGQTYHKLFKQYLEGVNYEISMKPEYIEERVIRVDN